MHHFLEKMIRTADNRNQVGKAGKSYSLNQKEKNGSPNYPLRNPTQNDNSYGSLDPLLVGVGDLEACERDDGGVDVLGEGKDDDGHLGGPQHQHHDPHVDEAGQWAEELVQG